MSVRTMGNKGEEQYHESCNGRSDFLKISTSTTMGASSSSAMDMIWWWKPLKHKWKGWRKGITGEEHNGSSSLSSQRKYIYLYIYIYRWREVLFFLSFTPLCCQKSRREDVEEEILSLFPFWLCRNKEEVKPFSLSLLFFLIHPLSLFLGLDKK